MNENSATTPIILCATAQGRAVIYGRVAALPVPGQPVTLTGARMVLRWAEECHGLFGLAADGPKGDTRITRTIPSVTETVWAQYLVCTDAAAAAIEGLE